MNKAEAALYEFNEMNELADRSSPVHRLPAISKFLVTITYLVILMSFGRYDFTGVLCMAVYPWITFQLCAIPFKTCLKKIRILIPFVILAGIFNPLFDTEICVSFGWFYLSSGWMSFIVLAVKGVLALIAAFLLVSTTKIDMLCAAMRRLHIPSMLVTLFLLTYRYISVLTEEVAVMSDAYHLRAPKQKGIHISAWGSFFGQLLLRTMDKAQALYTSMELRGFKGEFPVQREDPMTLYGILWILCWITYFVIFRFADVGALIVNPFMG